jgi:hypothetical protein
VLSEDEIRAIYYDGRNPTLLDALRAVERAVLEAVGGNDAYDTIKHLRAKVAELERENNGFRRNDSDLADEVIALTEQCTLLRRERDTALRELGEAREDTARLDTYLNGSFSVWKMEPIEAASDQPCWVLDDYENTKRTYHETGRAALDRAREGEP